MIIPRLLFKGDLQEAVKYVGLAKKLARQAFEAGLMNKVYRVAADVTITVENAIKANICKVLIDAERITHGIAFFPTSEVALFGWVYSDGERVVNTESYTSGGISYIYHLLYNVPSKKTDGAIYRRTDDNNICSDIKRDLTALYGNQRAYLWEQVSGKWRPVGKDVWTWWGSSGGDLLIGNLSTTTNQWLISVYSEVFGSLYTYTGYRSSSSSAASSRTPIPVYIWKNGELFHESDWVVLGVGVVSTKKILIAKLVEFTIGLYLYDKKTDVYTYIGPLYSYVKGAIEEFNNLRRTAIRFNANCTQLCGIIYNPTSDREVNLYLRELIVDILWDDDVPSIGTININDYILSRSYLLNASGTDDNNTWLQTETMSGRWPIAINYDELVLRRAWLDYDGCVSYWYKHTEDIGDYHSGYYEFIQYYMNPGFVIETNGGDVVLAAQNIAFRETVKREYTGVIDPDRGGAIHNYEQSIERNSMFHPVYLDLQSGIAVWLSTDRDGDFESNYQIPLQDAGVTSGDFDFTVDFDGTYNTTTKRGYKIESYGLNGFGYEHIVDVSAEGETHITASNLYTVIPSPNPYVEEGIFDDNLYFRPDSLFYTPNYISYGVITDYRFNEDFAYVYSFKINQRTNIPAWATQGSNLTGFDTKFAESNIEGDYISIHPLGLF